MNLATLILRKDIRHTRLLLVVWGLLVILQLTLVGWGMSPGDRQVQDYFALVCRLVPYLEILLLIVIIPYLIQDDPLVGTTGFWFTRPISGGALLRSKILYVALLLMLPPLLAELAAMTANGAGVHQLFLAAPQILLGQLEVVIPITILAVVCENFGRYAITGVVGMIAIELFELLLSWIRSKFGIYFGRPGYSPDAATFLNASRSVAWGLVIVIAGGAAIAHQYMARRTRRTVVLIAAGFALYSVALNFWPWMFIKPAPLPSSTAGFDPSSVEISISGGKWESSFSDLEVTSSISIANRGVPNGYLLAFRYIESQITSPDGKLNLHTSRSDFKVLERSYPDAMEYALGGIGVVNPNSLTFEGSPSVPVLTLDPNTYQRYAGVPLKLNATASFLASIYVPAWELPLDTGARYDNGSSHAIITKVDTMGDQVEVAFRVRDIKLLFQPTWMGTDESRVGTVYLLVNRARRQALLPSGINLQFASNIMTNTAFDLFFGVPHHHMDFIPDLTSDWLAHATLVRLDLVPQAAFSKEITSDNFVLNAPPPPYKRGRPDIEALHNITLPANATKKQVREYVTDILVASRNQDSWLGEDPQVGILEKVGPENLDVLIEFTRRERYNAESYVTRAIERLARPQDKELILEALPSDADLADVVVEYGWQADARKILIRFLEKDKSGDLPDSVIQAVASFRDPSTYPLLEKYLLITSNPQWAFDEIKGLPGIDLSKTVDALWQEKENAAVSVEEVLAAAPIAAEYGHADAIEEAAHVLETADNEYLLSQARKVITTYTPVTGEDKVLAAWVEENKGKLVFNKQTMKFEVKD